MTYIAPQGERRGGAGAGAKRRDPEGQRNRSTKPSGGRRPHPGSGRGGEERGAGRARCGRAQPRSVGARSRGGDGAGDVRLSPARAYRRLEEEVYDEDGNTLQDFAYDQEPLGVAGPPSALGEVYALYYPLGKR